jgi:hypothetical protein
MTDNSPFFVVGSGRCGSTLLRLMLSGHSRLHVPPETWFIADLVRELPLSGKLAPSQVTRAVEIMTSHYRWPDMRIEADDFRRRATALAAPGLVDIIDLVYRHHLRMYNKRRFGDKTPNYINIIPKIITLYPTAKFIHLMRDGRDVAISYVHMDDRRYYQRHFYWKEAMRRRRKYLGAPYADRILEVKYEDLVTAAEPTLRRLCAFLGEEFEPGMLNWQNLRELVPERERPIHTRLREPLRKEAVGVWRRELSGAECFAIEACLQRDLRSLGYRLRFSGAAWRVPLILSGWLFRAVAPLLARGIPYLQRRNYLPKAIYL